MPSKPTKCSRDQEAPPNCSGRFASRKIQHRRYISCSHSLALSLSPSLSRSGMLSLASIQYIPRVSEIRQDRCIGCNYFNVQCTERSAWKPVSKSDAYISTLFSTERDTARACADRRWIPIREVMVYGARKYPARFKFSHMRAALPCALFIARYARTARYNGNTSDSQFTAVVGRAFLTFQLPF